MTAQKGNKVKIHYRGTLADGSVFDNSFGGKPLEFEIGAGMVISGFENGIIGMKVGDKKTIFIPAEEAYGKKSDELILEFQKSDIPAEMSFAIGDMFQLQLTPEQSVGVKIIEIKDETVVFDANHALADKDLNFDIELMEIN
jgi:peptidylprolyl isomerase